MSDVPVKTYLLPRNSRTEISLLESEGERRRFNLTLDNEAGIYERFISKIQDEYGNLLSTREDIATYWLDEDNEMIGFLSDDGLRSAIQSAKPSSLFKVYIIRKPAESIQPAEQSSEEKVIHYGIFCSTCHGPVVGLRFKCTTCVNYDLCEACENKGIHKEHTLRVIETSMYEKSEMDNLNGLLNQFTVAMPALIGQVSLAGAPLINNHYLQILFRLASNIQDLSEPENLRSTVDLMQQIFNSFGINPYNNLDKKETDPLSPVSEEPE